MKKLLFLLFTIHCSLLTLFSQAPQSFNYQAVAWDDAGDLMKSTNLPVRISIFSESETGTLQWEETHSATTNEFGLFTLQIGTGTRTAGSATEFSDINWGSFSHFIKVEVDPAGGTSYQDMGTTQLLSVPYALSVSSLKSLNIEEPTGHDPDSALFEVKNQDGNIVFAVYNEGVRIYVDDNPAKGAKGGFAVGGFKTGKGITNEYMRITPDSIRIYVDSTSAKGSKGGFAVGGFKIGKGTSQEFLRVTTDSVRIYVKDESAKGSKGGFAVGGFKTGKSGSAINFMHLTPENYFIGHQAGSSMTTGLYNSFFGYESGMSTTTGSRNVFSGYKAGYSNTDGWKNILIGSYAGFSNDSGNYNVFLGDLAGYENTTGVQNIYIGAEAGYSSTTGGYNVILGAGAGSDITEGQANVFIGNFAGHENDTSSWNVFIGNSAGQHNIGGKSNVFLGNSSGRANTEGDWNVIIGNLTGRYNEDGEKNVFIGAESGYSNTSGYKNLFLGNLSGWYNTTGYRNVYVGSSSGLNSTDAVFNAFLGTSTGYHNTTGTRNTFIGNEAGYNNKTGGYNVYVGRLAGNKNENGDSCVFIGNAAGYWETGSNKLYIANSSSTPLIYGDFSSKLVTINGDLNVNNNNFRILDNPGTGLTPLYYAYQGSVVGSTGKEFSFAINDGLWVRTYVWADNYYSNSDIRFKKNIQNIDNALSKVNQIQGIYYELTGINKGWNKTESNTKGSNTDKRDIGFIAQDLENVFPELVNTDMNGYKSVSYGKMTPILLEAIKEQQTMIEALQQEIQDLKDKIK